METRRSPVHEIVHCLWQALEALGVKAHLGDIERWGFAIHASLSAPGREFHNHRHVLEIVRDSDPLEALAALYHDAVYMQVDQGLPRAMAQTLETLLREEAGGWRILPGAAEGPTKDVLPVFDRRVGEVVTLSAGLNELASAMVAVVHLSPVLERSQRIAIAACIEQTVPFRADPCAALAKRLDGLGITGSELRTTMIRAVRLGNRDVENFGESNPARFLDNTWKLLPESNPSLHSPMVYTVREYRVALHKMEAFLSWLPAERVFHSWGGEPEPAKYERMVERVTTNLALAVRYLRAKLYSIAMVEAIADVTGGDVPLDYFMGGGKSPARPTMRRIEQFLPELGDREDLDPPLHRLLAEGRASESSFDISPSPLGAFLHVSIGEAAMMAGVEDAKRWWNGEITALEFLTLQDAESAVAILNAAAEIVETRKVQLEQLLAHLQRAAAR
ncbi:MAG: hypothetical protein R3B48_08695 [Kofleriaceae bacterium]